MSIHVPTTAAVGKLGSASSVHSAVTPSRGSVNPLLKWPGGKTAELPLIRALMPATFDRYMEPFAGGAALFFDLPVGTPSVLNDTSRDLVDFYELVQRQDEALFRQLQALAQWWHGLRRFVQVEGDDLVALWHRRLPGDQLMQAAVPLVQRTAAAAVALGPTSLSILGDDLLHLLSAGVPKKLARMRKVEEQRGLRLPEDDVWLNLEGAYLAALYTAVRSAYNRLRREGVGGVDQTAFFFFLREYAYAAMFRFNGRGEFNVPYGGVSYNRKDFTGKLEHLASDAVSKRLGDASITCADFEIALDKAMPGERDFIFLDPPYDSDFSDYDRAQFDLADQRRLANLLHGTRAKFLLVIKSTPAILDLYTGSRFHIHAVDKKYMWTIKERNDRNATHLMITNYRDEAPPVLALF